MRVSKEKVTFSIVGAGARSTNYIKALEERYHDKFSIVAIAEPNKSKRDYFVEKYNIPEENIFDDYREFNEKDRLSDVVIIGTLDDMHFVRPVLRTPDDQTAPLAFKGGLSKRFLHL